MTMSVSGSTSESVQGSSSGSATAGARTTGTSTGPASGPSRSPRATSPLRRRLKHVLVLARRNLVKTVRTPEQFIDVTIQPAIFIALFVYVFGGAFAGGSRHDYLQYLLPGLLAQGVAMGSIALGQNMNADIEKGVFDRFRSLPIARSAPLVGAVLADFVRYLLVLVVTLGFGYLVGFRIETNPVALLAAIVLALAFALCFCWVSLWVGLIVRTSGSVQGVMFLLIFPLSFGSSAFVPTHTMPGWLQAWNTVNPITRLVDSVRALMVGGPLTTNLLATFAWMAGLLAVFVPLAMRAYRRRG